MMIENEVIKILKKKSTSLQARMLGNLTDEFRSGRDPVDLLRLLDSTDDDIIYIGIYIAGEILINNNVVLQSIIERMKILVDHDNSKIRYNILTNLGALLESVVPSEAVKLYLKMSQDIDESISVTAKRFLRECK